MWRKMQLGLWFGVPTAALAAGAQTRSVTAARTAL